MDPDRDVLMGLLFECNGRTAYLEDRRMDEVEAMDEQINGPFAGFFSNGELGAIEGNYATANFVTVSSLIIYED
ncbi:MAG: FIST C-terminal domain-containing protein [Candidatus Nanohaloarchaea archaeon]